MKGIPIILVTLIIGLILIGVLVAIFLWKRKSEGISKEPDYRAFFIMGNPPIGLFGCHTFIEIPPYKKL